MLRKLRPHGLQTQTNQLATKFTDHITHTKFCSLNPETRGHCILNFFFLGGGESKINSPLKHNLFSHIGGLAWFYTFYIPHLPNVLLILPFLPLSLAYHCPVPSAIATREFDNFTILFWHVICLSVLNKRLTFMHLIGLSRMCDMLGMSCSALGADSEKSWVFGQAVFSLLSLTPPPPPSLCHSSQIFHYLGFAGFELSRINKLPPASRLGIAYLLFPWTTHRITTKLQISKLKVKNI